VLDASELYPLHIYVVDELPTVGTYAFRIHDFNSTRLDSTRLDSTRLDSALRKNGNSGSVMHRIVQVLHTYVRT